jgi:hypothetical protein
VQRSAEDLLLVVQAKAAEVAPQLTPDDCRRLLDRLARGARPISAPGESAAGR